VVAMASSVPAGSLACVLAGVFGFAGADFRATFDVSTAGSTMAAFFLGTTAAPRVVVLLAAAKGSAAAVLREVVLRGGVGGMAGNPRGCQKGEYRFLYSTLTARPKMGAPLCRNARAGCRGAGFNPIAEEP
jgi:hypothetical protein